MPQIVKCEVCGKVSNQSYINSHKRLAHGIGRANSLLAGEPQKLQAVLALYAQLSEEGKRQIRSHLRSAETSD